MASILQKLARNNSTTRLITCFTNPISTHPPLPFFNHLSQTNPTQLVPLTPSQPKTEGPFSHHPLHFYPSFSFGCFLNPISLSGLVQSGNQEEEAVSGDSGLIWADSVKKKRKRKMNKHKLKKLRKRLRRKT
ncbi:hypothetical protein AgCh_012066 [Apium graveolens]